MQVPVKADQDDQHIDAHGDRADQGGRLDTADDAAAEQSDAGDDEAEVVQAGLIVLLDAVGNDGHQQWQHYADAAEQKREADEIAGAFGFVIPADEGDAEQEQAQGNREYFEILPHVEVAEPVNDQDKQQSVDD